MELEDLVISSLLWQNFKTQTVQVNVQKHNSISFYKSDIKFQHVIQ